MTNKIISDETTNSVLRMSPTLRRDEGHMKVIVMRERDWWKVKYLEGRERVLEMEPEQLAEILLKMEIGGKVEYSDNGTKVTKRGIDKSTGEARLVNAMENGNDWIGEADKKSGKQMIINFMKQEKKNHKPSVTTSAIKEAVKKNWNVKEQFINFCIQELYCEGILKLIKTNKSGHKLWGI